MKGTSIISNNIQCLARPPPVETATFSVHSVGASDSSRRGTHNECSPVSPFFSKESKESAVVLAIFLYSCHSRFKLTVNFPFPQNKRRPDFLPRSGNTTRSPRPLPISSPYLPTGVPWGPAWLSARHIALYWFFLCVKSMSMNFFHRLGLFHIGWVTLVCLFFKDDVDDFFRAWKSCRRGFVNPPCFTRG